MMRQWGGGAGSAAPIAIDLKILQICVVKVNVSADHATAVQY